MPDDLQITDGMPHNRRAGAWIVLVMGLVGLGLGAYQWRASFKAAFATNAGDYKTPDQVEAARLEEMKNKDTDGDTLSDYDETYVYQTSPYLDDSDSDGVKDQDELKAGEDPNCPKGTSCGIEVTASATTSVSAVTDELQSDVTDQLLHPTPAQIRALLLQSGVSETDLKNIDDATLLDLYQQSLTEVQRKSDTTPSP